MVNFEDENRLREDENTHLAQMAKTQGFKVLQKMAKDMEEMSLKTSFSENLSAELRLIKLGEISGIRKLLHLVVSRSES
jgi:hypothetical protein